jgi:hypothetical protein
LFSRQTHIHPSLTKIQSLLLQTCNQLLSRFFNALLRRNVHGKPWLALVPLSVLEACLALVEPKEDYLRLVQRGIILRNCLVFAAVEWVIANNGLHVGEFALGEFVWRVHKGIEVVEQQEGCGRVFERLRQEGVVGSQEGDAVEWGALNVSILHVS